MSRSRVGAVRAIMLVLASACYDPTANEGAPCSAEGACPAGQTCDLASRRCFGTPPAPDGLTADAPPDASSSDFFDDFSRPDHDELGNGWIEKNATVYGLLGGEVVRIPTVLESYRDNMCYRPASEDVLDVEISVNVRFTAILPGYAQIFVRAVSATITRPDAYDGYLLYVVGSQPDELVLGRQIGTPFVTTLSRFTLSEPFNTTDVFRLTLRAEGTLPVQLKATVERLAGTRWIVIGETTAEDSDPTRIAVPGTVGFAGNEVATYIYDEFRRTEI